MPAFKQKLAAFFTLETASAYRLLLAPLVVLLLAITVVPTLFAIYTSTHDYRLTELDKDFIGISNFVDVLKDGRFWGSFKTTSLYIVGALIPELILGLILAMLLQRNFRGNKLAKSLFLLPTITTPVVIGLIWIMMYDPQFGIINYIFHSLGLPGQTWLSNPKTALWVLVSIDIWEWTPFVALILYAGLQSVPNEPYESASVDGANRLQTFFHLTLPFLTPYLVIACIFRLMDTFKWFDTIYVMTKGGPGTSTETLNMYAYLTGFKFLDMGHAAAIGIIMLVVITVLSQIIAKKTNVLG